MSSPSIKPRIVEARLEDALEDTPVVLIHGPRRYGDTVPKIPNAADAVAKSSSRPEVIEAAGLCCLKRYWHCGGTNPPVARRIERNP